MSKPVSIKHPILIVILILLLAGGLAFIFLRFTGSDGKPEPIAESGPLQTTTEQPSQPAEPQEVPGQLVISASAESGRVLYTSRPLIISAFVWRKALVPDDKGNLPTAQPITLTGKNGSWREALMVQIKNAEGKTIAWPLHPMNPEEKTLSLDVDASAHASWFLEPSETEGLLPGTYTLAISFDPGKVEGLPGYVATDRFHLKIEKEQEKAGSETEKKLQAVHFSLFKKDLETAGKMVDQILSDDPENLEGLSLKSILLAEKGEKPEAVATVNKALMIYYSKFPDADPPLGLIQQRAGYLADMKPEPVKAEGGSPSQ